MSTVQSTSTYRGPLDHFEPENPLNPAEQRRLRGHLEQIDYTAFAANQAVLKSHPGVMDLGSVQRLAVAAAQARADWIEAALALAAAGKAATPAQVAELANRRMAFDELCQAYEGVRRMIERGYVGYSPGH